MQAQDVSLRWFLWRQWQERIAYMVISQSKCPEYKYVLKLTIKYWDIKEYIWKHSGIFLHRDNIIVWISTDDSCRPQRIQISKEMKFRFHMGHFCGLKISSYDGETRRNKGIPEKVISAFLRIGYFVFIDGYDLKIPCICMMFLWEGQHG